MARPPGSKNGVRRATGRAWKAGSGGGDIIAELDITPFLYRNVWQMYRDGVPEDGVCNRLNISCSMFAAIIYKNRQPNTHRCPACNALLREPIDITPCATCAANRARTLTKATESCRANGEVVVLTNGSVQPIDQGKLTLAPRMVLAIHNVAMRQKQNATRDQRRLQERLDQPLEELKPRGRKKGYKVPQFPGETPSHHESVAS